MNNTAIQWVTNYTKYRGEDKPSRLDLLFTKEINLKNYINYECPFRSDHVVLEIEITGDIEDKQEESYKKKKNYAKANFTPMKEFSMELTGRKWRS